MTRHLRVVANRHPTEWACRQELQVRGFFGWRAIDSEEIPSDVLITRAICGDFAGWKSKFAGVIEYLESAAPRPSVNSKSESEA